MTRQGQVLLISGESGIGKTRQILQESLIDYQDMGAGGFTEMVADQLAAIE